MDSYGQQTQLSSQLLRTCQTIPLEAGDVLYRDNTLIVYCNPEASGCWRSLNISAPLPTRLSQGFADAPDLISFAAHHEHHDCRSKAAHRRLTESYPSLLRSKLVQVNLRSSSVESTFLACRLLYGLLSGEGREITLALASTLSVPG